MIDVAKDAWRTGEVAGKPTVWVKCPGCKAEYRLDHEVAVDGTVTPSVDCPTCPFHDMVRLNGYGEGG